MKRSVLLIPKHDIDKLEKARINLHEIIENTPEHMAILTHVTPIMYHITHRKYRRAE